MATCHTVENYRTIPSFSASTTREAPFRSKCLSWDHSQKRGAFLSCENITPTVMFRNHRFFHLFWIAIGFLKPHHGFQYPDLIAFGSPRSKTCDRESIFDHRISHHRTDSRRNQPFGLKVSSTDSMPPSQNDVGGNQDEEIFDEETWTAFEAIVNEAMSSPRVLKKDKSENMGPVKDFLLSNRRLINSPSPLTRGGAFRGDMQEQKLVFTEKYGWNSKQYDFAMRCLVYMGDFCAKRQNPRPIAVAWYKMKEAGMIPRENGITTFMYVLSQADSCSEALDEVATFHDILYPPNEKSITLRINSLIAKNDAAGAEEMLASLSVDGKSEGMKKLRTFMPIMEYYCSVGDTSSILRLLRQMRDSSSVLFDAEAFGLIIGGLAKHGSFLLDASPIEGAVAAGFSVDHGPKLFDEVAAEMAEDLMELTEAAALTISQSFEVGFSKSDEMESIPILNDKFSPISAMVGRVTINGTTAICPASGSKLRLFALGEDQRKHVHDTLLEMAGIQHQKFAQWKHDNPKYKNKQKQNSTDTTGDNIGYQELARFSEWIGTREGEPFTAIVDGPNVAYFGNPELHYSQVQLVVDELKKMGETPLVTMPSKYVAKRFQLSSGRLQELSTREIQIMNGLLESGSMYVVTSQCLDDYYWMLASVTNQTNARQQDEFHVSATDGAGRFPGMRPMLVTNDKMRDHKLDLLEPREFRRWCSCHIVNYKFSAFVKDEWEENREVIFHPADFFSREIQGNAHESGNGLVWQFPVTGWEEPDRLCIWINQ